MIREAFRELEKTFGRREFLSRTVKVAGLALAVDRFGEKSFGVDSSGNIDSDVPLAVYRALGNLIIPVDEDPGWATFDPQISEYGLNVFLKETFFAGSVPSFQATLGAYNLFDEAPARVGYGPRFTAMSEELQKQFLTDVLAGQFENDGMQELLFFAAFLTIFSTKAVFFSNFPYHLADPAAEFQVPPSTAVKTGWQIMRFKGPVGPEEENALRAKYRDIEVLSGVDLSNPFI